MRMTATARQEKEMKMKYEKMKNQPDTSPLEKLRAYILAKGVCSLKRLNQSFKRIDTNKDGKMDFKEFQDALQYEGIMVDQAIERQCYSEIDTDNSGEVSFDEFLVALRPPLNSSRKNLIMQAFRKLDKDGSGELTVDDLRGVYSGKKHPKYLSGEWTEDQVLMEFLKSFNGPGKPFTGALTYQDFEAYYAGVSASIDSDAYFDLMMRQAWKL